MKIGEKIRQLRMQYGLTQEELADRCELSKGFISQLENDITSPSIATLVDILTCLGTDLKTFFDDDREQKIAFGPEDYSVKQDTQRNNEIAWIIPSAQKNSMEPIRLLLEPGGSTAPDSPPRRRGIRLCPVRPDPAASGRQNLPDQKRRKLLFYPVRGPLSGKSGKNQSRCTLGQFPSKLLK